MLQPGGGAQVWFEDETERERERERERVGVSKRLDNRHIAASLTLTDHVGPSHTHTHTWFRPSRYHVAAHEYKYDAAYGALCENMTPTT